MYEEHGARMYRPPLSTGQKAVKYFADAAPALGGFAGGLIGGGADAAASLAAAPVTGGASLPAGWASAIPAITGGSMVGGGLGAAAQLAAYKAAGIPFDESAGGVARHLGKNAAYEGASGVVGGVLGGVTRSAAPAVAKVAVGQAEPGIEKEVLRYKLPISTESIAKMKNNVSQMFDEISGRGKDLDASGVKFKWSDIGQKLGGNVERAAESDVVSRKGELALKKALEVLRTKYGPQAKEATVRRSAGVGEMGGGQVIDPHFLVPEGDLIKPSKLVEIMRYSRQRINDLIEQRKVPGASPRPAGPLEKAYSDIYDQTLALLKDADPAIGEAGVKMSDMYRLMETYNDALSRGTSKVGALVSGLSGMPSPEASSRIALTMQSPRTYAAMRAVPVAPNVTGRMMGAFGAPADATDAMLIRNAERRKK